MKNFIIKQLPDFQLRVCMSDCDYPPNLKNLEFVRETLDQNGQVINDSCYQFFLTAQQLEQLLQGLKNT
jgi:hypothetical protein